MAMTTQKQQLIELLLAFAELALSGEVTQSDLQGIAAAEAAKFLATLEG